jgi:hypothetical protein
MTENDACLFLEQFREKLLHAHLYDISRYLRGSPLRQVRIARSVLCPPPSEMV